jgi:hypothetical protein
MAVSQGVTKASREALAPYGITPVQFAILKVLWERDGLNDAELCGRLVLDSATATGVTGASCEPRGDELCRRLFSRIQRPGVQQCGSHSNDEC